MKLIEASGDGLARYFTRVGLEIRQRHAERAAALEVAEAVGSARSQSRSERCSRMCEQNSPRHDPSSIGSPETTSP